MARKKPFTFLKRLTTNRVEQKDVTVRAPTWGIVHGYGDCLHCGESSQVAAIWVPSFESRNPDRPRDTEHNRSGGQALLSEIWALSPECAKQVAEWVPSYCRPWNAAPGDNDDFYSNCCMHCGKLIPDQDLREADGAFDVTPGAKRPGNVLFMEGEFAGVVRRVDEAGWQTDAWSDERTVDMEWLAETKKTVFDPFFDMPFGDARALLVDLQKRFEPWGEPSKKMSPHQVRLTDALLAAVVRYGESDLGRNIHPYSRLGDLWVVVQCGVATDVPESGGGFVRGYQVDMCSRDDFHLFWFLFRARDLPALERWLGV